MKNKVILFLDIFGNGGIEKFIYMLSNYIDQNKFDVSVLAVIKDNYSYNINLLKKNNIPLQSLLKKFEVNPIIRMKKGHKAFKKYLKNAKKDIIIHFNISNSIDLQYAKMAYNLGFYNLVLHSHNSNATSFTKRFAHVLFKPINHVPNCINLACSKKSAIWLYNKKDIKIGNYKIINNAINVQDYSFNQKVRDDMRKKLELSDAFVVGHIGRYNIQKNHFFLIDIFEEVLKKRSNAHLLLIGEGSLQERVIEYINSKNLVDFVTIINQTETPNMFLQAMDVFVLPSLYEGLPFVLIESQAAGLPSIISDTITPEIDITNLVKFISLQENKETWCQEILASSDIKRHNTSKEIIKAGFDIKNSIKEIENIYLKLLKKKGQFK